MFKVTIVASLAIAVMVVIGLMSLPPSASGKSLIDSRTTVPASMNGIRLTSGIPSKGVGTMVLLPTCTSCSVSRFYALTQYLDPGTTLFIAQDLEGAEFVQEQRELDEMESEFIVYVDASREIFRPAAYQMAPIICLVNSDSTLFGCRTLDLAQVAPVTVSELIEDPHVEEQ